LLRLHQYYLRRFILLFVILFLVVGGIARYWLNDFYIDQTKNALKQNIKLISYNLYQKNNLDKLVQNIKNDLNIRVTIIDQEGTVIAESHEDKNLMDNHKYRTEIIQSQKNDFGYMIRHSETIDRDLIYVVKQYTINNKIFYIRTSKELSAINEQITTLGIDIFIVLFVFLILLFYVTYKINQKVKLEIDLISKFLFDLTKKKKSSYIKSEFSQEFYQITTLLTKISKILIKQDKQKSKYTSKLKASNEQKDNIISAISHEFKNPIAVINGYTQTLIEDPNINKTIQEKFLTKIQKNSIRLNNLIDTLRLSTKLEQKKQILNYKKVNLLNIIQDACESLQPSYKYREIIIEQKEENINISADEILLGVAIINLIENALKYSEEDVTVQFSNKYIKVIDTGIGIKEEDISKITEKFYRVSSNTWNNSLGLGLSIVVNIVNIHKFKLEIQSHENEGSTFTIKF
jgi:signal transduction histidine kinase